MPDVFERVAAVTGTFFQGTQPVCIASMPSTPVSNVNLDVALSTLATSAAQTAAQTSLTALLSAQQGMPSYIDDSSPGYSPAQPSIGAPNYF